MPLPAAIRMTSDEFLDWLQGQDVRHELVGGVPVAMAGARRRHDRIVVNTLAALHAQLRGKSCQPFTADTAVRIPNGDVRFADAGVDCGIFRDEALAADAPTFVVEVLSASTRNFDLFRKLEEYKTVPSLRHILIVDPDEPQAILWNRTDEGAWQHEPLEGLAAVAAPASLPVVLRFAELYEGLEFRPRPRLVAATSA